MAALLIFLNVAKAPHQRLRMALARPCAALLPAATTKAQINPWLSLWLDEKLGQVSLPKFCGWKL
jgi:hypothetical protein